MTAVEIASISDLKVKRRKGNDGANSEILVTLPSGQEEVLFEETPETERLIRDKRYVYNLIASIAVLSGRLAHYEKLAEVIPEADTAFVSALLGLTELQLALRGKKFQISDYEL